jgi:hypothetical protein
MEVKRTPPIKVDVQHKAEALSGAHVAMWNRDSACIVDGSGLRGSGCCGCFCDLDQEVQPRDVEELLSTIELPNEGSGIAKASLHKWHCLQKAGKESTKTIS